ncbi:putative ABC transporter [Boeremia exigua]|uniref:putative ABC transporter n=1 Tax=Boeremia exigua TaxID=749465 RepID=UPI001E8E6547|nr:putative ABC transporter [Boeremia exigua]KAH6622419.1 putative ABC transporter [Boeremia exigua]
MPLQEDTAPPSVSGNAKSEQKPTSLTETPNTKNEKETKDGEKDVGSLHYFIRVHWQYSTALDHTLRFVGFAAAIGSGVLPPLMTLLFGSSVNYFNDFEEGRRSGDDLYDKMTANALWLLYLFIGRFVLVYVHSTCFSIIGIRVTSALRLDFIRSLMRQDVSYIDSCSSGTISSTISNNPDMIENSSTEKVGSLVQNLSMFIAAFVVAFTQQWKLTLVTATTLPVLFTGYAITFGLDAKIEAEIMEIYNQAAGLVQEALGSVRVVTAFGASAKLSRKYDAPLAKAQALGFRKGPVIGGQWSVEFFTTYCAYALAWYYGIKLLNRGEAGDGGQIISVLLAVLLGTTAASNVAPGFGDFAKGSAAAQGMFAIIDRKSEIDALDDSGRQPPQCNGSIELHSVSFAYPSRPSEQILRDFSLSFEAGKITALVGSSGSGKSTIVGLIERWFDPNSGDIYLDGHNIAELNLGWLRGQIGLVQQEPVLFSDTIFNNVAHGLYRTPMENLPETEKRELVRQACQQAFADEFIQKLPQKYDTKVGESGALLSGGQKQRIAIARSIISDPKILLLDEATSALDPEAESKVQASLDNVSKKRTTILIAHKLATVQKADKIVVLNRGQVVEQGTHDQLLDHQGAYYELVHAQTLDIDSEDSPTPLTIAVSTTSELEKPSSREIAVSKLPVVEEDEDHDISRKLSLIKVLGVIFKQQRTAWPLFFFGIVSSTIGGGMFPGQAILFGYSVQTLQIQPSDYLVSRGSFWALMYFVFSLGILICYLGVGFFWTMASSHASRFYRREYLDAMLRQDVAFFDMRGHGAAEMTSRLSLHPDAIRSMVSTNMALIIIIFVDVIATSILAIAVAWKFGLVIVVAGMPTLFCAGYFRLRLEMANHDRLKDMYLECARFASEAVSSIRTVSSLTLEHKVLGSFQSRLDECSKREFRSKMVTMLVHAFAESINLAVTSLAFWYGGKLLSQGEYSLRDFFIAFMAVLIGSQTAGILFGFSSDVSRAHAAANHIIALRESRPPINTSTGSKISNTGGKAPIIEFRDVNFAYASRPNHNVLKGLNLSIQRGQSIGIVGASGCGKSTIIALLERFYDVTSGQLLVGGTPLSQLDVHHHRSNIGLVSQDTMLFQGTIRENVLLGLRDEEQDEATASERVERACRSANMHEFILSLPDGYLTDIGNRGVALSGGQRQRLAIARALIREPDLLLFDEATSALDTTNEALVQQAIELVAQEQPDRTTIAVAHRLSTIKRCDCIFVLHEGQVDEQGTHEELVRKRGRYYAMVLAQSLDRET